MGELSIFTIIVSLAVCSILVVILHQYVTQRISVIEHSQKEQAMILHQYIEESSYEIHSLKQQIFTTPQHILQTSFDNSNDYEVYYQNTHDSNDCDDTVQHKHVHIDTVMYDTGIRAGNNNHRLIPVSSDSENTTTDNDSDSSDTDSGSDSSDSDSSSDNDLKNIHNKSPQIKIIEISSQDITLQQTCNEHDSDSDESDSDESDSDENKSETESDTSASDTASDIASDIHETVDKYTSNDTSKFVFASTILDISDHMKSVSINLANDKLDNISIEQIDISNDISSDIVGDIVGGIVEDITINLSLLSNNTICPIQQSDIEKAQPVTEKPNNKFGHTYSGMPVNELRQFIKDKYKQNPEKMAEIGDIQKMKKAALLILAEE